MSINKQFQLNGKVAIVTGASTWLGHDMATTLAEAGANVIVTSRNRQKADETAFKINQWYPTVKTFGLTMEQTKWESVEICFKKAFEWQGRIDILINNAGGGVGKSEGYILKRQPQAIFDMININLTGVIYCCKAAASKMVEHSSGKIINIASVAALVGRDRRMYDRSGLTGQPVDYAAAKAGVLGLTRDLAASLAPHGITVNAISPGGFYKGNLPEQFNTDYANETMLGRWGKMEHDIKGAALFLSSEASDYITGQNIVVDGGFSIFK